ncbi:MutS protein msh5 [Phytophthora pseudosyringae]|uniref:MutS protein msh5 n=1 Tax=Phytophthora pseudosyringae TaxID=221518 RepID=A0A8T1VFB9_9STRA|nr:MutS protein msh5 [Phytophthora pseudosyringae]
MATHVGRKHLGLTCSCKQRREEEELSDPSDVEVEDEEVVFMSMLFDRGELGVAIYNALTTSLKTLRLQIADPQELGETIERLHTQFEVNHVLVSSRNASSNGMLRMVKKLDEAHQTKTGISVRKHSGNIGGCVWSLAPVSKSCQADFNYLKGCQAIEHVQIGTAPSEYRRPHARSSRREAYTFLGSFFDFESTQLIRATGALLLYLSTEKVHCDVGEGVPFKPSSNTLQIGNQLDDVESVFFSTVEQVALDGFMYIDKSTLQSLQIFNHEAHPSLVKGSGRAKEGFSLFGLLNRTVTKSGSCTLRRWMLAPLVSGAEIDERQRSVAFFTDSENDEVRQLLFGKLKRFRDVAGIFQRIKRRCASVGDWCRFAASTASFLEAQSLFEDIRETSNSSLPNVFSRVTTERGIIHVSNLLGNVVDFEESQKENIVVIRSGVSEALDAARERYEDLDNVLTEVAFQVQEANPALSSITVQYIPQVGYVICCESPTTLPDFVFQFQEDDTTFYYKDACCRDLDESIGDIYGYILDIQRELLEELTMALLEYESSMHEMTWVMSYLDCMISFASCAKSFNFTRPQITESNTLKATKARHPLQELLVEHYIPNDIFLDSSDSLKIVTGFNGSGKSVYLKLVGLLQYMAQIGSFVPAETAEIGLVTKVFTRIQSMESATVSQSSFTIDCNQMAWMLNHGDGRSLFLIDEFGKGTAELDGIALLSSIINYLAKKNFTTGRPRVVLTTHFLEIFRNNLLEPALVDQLLPGEQSECSPDTPRVVCTVMASTDAPESYSATSNTAPLYELRHGISTHSNALTCAANCGIPQELVERAQEVLDCTKRGAPISSRQQSAGPSPEEQLAAFFTSIADWQAAGDDVIAKFLAMARMGTH